MKVESRKVREAFAYFKLTQNHILPALFAGMYIPLSAYSSLPTVQGRKSLEKALAIGGSCIKNSGAIRDKLMNVGDYSTSDQYLTKSKLDQKSGGKNRHLITDILSSAINIDKIREIILTTPQDKLIETLKNEQHAATAN
jgi:hypothetical protein